MRKKREIVVKGFAISQIISIILLSVSFGFLISETQVVSAIWYYDENGVLQEWTKPGTPEGIQNFFITKDQALNNPPVGVGKVASNYNGENMKLKSRDKKGLGSMFSPSGSTSRGNIYLGEIQEGASFSWKGKDYIIPKGAVGRYTQLPDGKWEVEIGNNKIPGLTDAEFSELRSGLSGDGIPFTDAKQYDLFGLQFSGGFAHLVEGAVFAGAVAGAIQLLAPLFGASKELTNTLTIASVAGIMSFKGLQSLGPSGFNFIANPNNFFLQHAGLIGLGVGVVVFIALYKKEKQRVVQFQCLPWEPPLGGANCEECNKDSFRPCSEYRCKSLGQACELVNAGTEEESCIWKGRNDVTSPTITPWDDALSDGHSYTSHDTRPPSRGTKIVRDDVSDGCLKAFTPLEFGLLTNEPAQCKADYEHRDTYEEMVFLFGGTNFYLYNHTQRMSLPGPDSVNSEFPELENDGTYDLFVRCRDANGNTNEDEFVISYCVDPSPDTTPPEIVDSSIPSGSPVTYNIGEVDVEFYLNEPAQCKWSVQDKEYSVMENEMSCSNSIIEINARNLYPCSTTLNGIRDREENKYFVRCKDLPNKPDEERNVNVQSYEYVLKGTQPLNIINVLPEEGDTIRDSTDIVDVTLGVETSNGADEGKALCYFSGTGNEGSYVQMFETNNFMHKQTLSLVGGQYTYHFRCVDAGGNSDNSSTTFNVFVDTRPPMITRAYKELDALKVVTDEDAECTYSLNSCNFNFDEGVKMIHVNPDKRKTHFTPWEANLVYHIKCKDDFGNEPPPNTCNLIASATNIR